MLAGEEFGYFIDRMIRLGMGMIRMITSIM
jgi:hypothetical protein